jgi:hypothetical protein
MSNPQTILKIGFTPIQLDDYVALHLRANPAVERGELMRELAAAIAAHRSGARCQCGAPIWSIGSAHMGLGCFTCITGQAAPEGDYEIEVSEDDAGS